jgi:hypothetical protein
MSRAYPSGAYYGVLPGSARFITSKRPEKNSPGSNAPAYFGQPSIKKKKDI